MKEINNYLITIFDSLKLFKNVINFEQSKTKFSLLSNPHHSYKIEIAVTGDPKK